MGCFKGPENEALVLMAKFMAGGGGGGRGEAKYFLDEFDIGGKNVIILPQIATTSMLCVACKSKVSDPF